MQTVMGSVSPAFNIDDVHRDVLRNLVIEHGLTAFTARDQREICRAWHELDAWTLRRDWPGSAPAIL
jgi:hypothetical protein